MNINKIRLVTFDVVGTILKFRVPAYVTYKEVASHHGVSVDLSRLEKHFLLQYKNLNKSHPHFGSTTGLPSRVWWTTLVRETFRGAMDAADWDDGRVGNIAEELYNIYHTPQPYLLYQDAADALEKFKMLNKTIGIISNFDVRIHDLVTAMGLRSYVDFVICSEDARSSKPDSAIFNLAVLKSNLEHLQPDEVLHIGDDFERDYLGARAVKWNTLLLHRGGAIGYSVPKGHFTATKITEIFEREKS